MLSDRCLSCLSVCLSVLSVTLVYCGQTVGRIKMKLGMQIRLGPWPHVLDGDTGPPSQKGHNPQFSAHICCGPMARWIKTPHPQKGRTHPIFHPCLLLSDGCMDQDATWYKGRPRPPLCYMGTQLPRLKRGTAPNFWPMSWPNGRPSQLLLSTCTDCRCRWSYYVT